MRRVSELRLNWNFAKVAMIGIIINFFINILGVSNQVMTDSIKKRTKRREIMLTDDNDSDDPVVVGSPRRSVSSSRKQKIALQTHDHLVTRKQIEELRDKFGSNWLNADGENIVKEVFPRTENWEDDLVRRRILIDELNDDSILSSTPKEGIAVGRLETTEEQVSGGGGGSTVDTYGTASERTLVSTTESSTRTVDGYESAVQSKEEVEELSSSSLLTSSDLTGLDFFQSQHSVEDETPEPNEVEYYVEKIRTAREENGRRLLVVVSDLSIKEKDPQSKE